MMLRSLLTLLALSLCMATPAFAQVAGLPGAVLQQEMQRHTQPEIYAPWAFQAQAKLKPKPVEPVQIIRETTDVQIAPEATEAEESQPTE